jgi:hypothetical protein
MLLLSSAWCIPHLGVSCADLNSNSIGAIAHNTNSDSSNHNSSSSSTMLLLHHHSMLQSGHHIGFPPATSHTSTAESWDTSPASASCPRKAIHHELNHPWSINRGALDHGLVVPTTPPWMRSPREKKLWQVHFTSTNILLSYYLIMEHHMTF